jgi:hypothetical protein
MAINDGKIYLRICKSGLTYLQMPPSNLLDRSKAEFGTSLLSITPTRQAVVCSLILASPASSKVGFDKSVSLCHLKFTSARRSFDLFSHSHERIFKPRATGIREFPYKWYTSLEQQHLAVPLQRFQQLFAVGTSQTFQDSSACTYHQL